MKMTDKLTTFAKILSENGFSDYRLRLLGHTNSVRLELRGLSDADMAAFSGEPTANAKSPSYLVDKPPQSDAGTPKKAEKQ